MLFDLESESVTCVLAWLKVKELAWKIGVLTMGTLLQSLW
jgi:hypothetical protein